MSTDQKTFSSGIAALPYWFTAFLAVHLAARGMIMATLADSLPGGWLWLRGLASDIASASALALVALALSWLHRRLPYLLLALWCGVMAGNYDYIAEWQENISVHDIGALGEIDFLRGSVLTWSLAFQLTVLLAAGLLAAWPVARLRLPRWLLLVMLLAAVATLPLMRLWLTPPQLWVQQNVFEKNFRELARNMHPQTLEPPIPGWAKVLAQAKHAQLYAQDITGKPFVKTRTGLNVLVIVAESLSQTTVDKGWLPYLQSVAELNLHYTQIVNPNIITVRGLYSLLCGRPSFYGVWGRENVAHHIEKMRTRCLPKLLAGQGYRTFFLQGAGLGFQGKDNIMPDMGFSEVYGHEKLAQGRRVTHWGLDDASLFASAMEVIDLLEKDKRDTPWMMTLLTVGTHHPYSVDLNFRRGLPNRERAYRFLDQSLQEFLSWLETTGRFKDTLIIITTDESRDALKFHRRIRAPITRNHGFMVILTPEQDQARLAMPYMQSDLALSIADYLGITPSPDFTGRSLFRRYREFRPLVFADYVEQTFSAVLQPGELTVCRTENWGCRMYGLNNASLFDRSQDFGAGEVVPADAMLALHRKSGRLWVKNPKLYGR